MKEMQRATYAIPYLQTSMNGYVHNYYTDCIESITQAFMATQSTFVTSQWTDSCHSVVLNDIIPPSLGLLMLQSYNYLYTYSPGLHIYMYVAIQPWL